LKWRIRRMADKAVLMLVSIKPIRWFLDQLFRFGKWAQSKPWLAHIWEWYKKLIKPFWIGYLGYSLIVDAWSHNILNVLLDIAWLLIIVFMPDRDEPDDEDEDEDEPDDPTPNGDAVDMWLKEQQRIEI
jgi:hypothetical protein